MFILFTFEKYSCFILYIHTLNCHLCTNNDAQLGSLKNREWECDLFLNTCTFLTQIYAFWSIPEMTHPSLHLNEQFHFYFLLTEVSLPILNILYYASYFDFSAKSLATEYLTGELSPDRRVHGSRPKKGETAWSLRIGSLKENAS